ncbi:MAG: hypothetical protein ACI88H_000162 [Cocleimonas sp.]|jgi:uncharacterized protein (TIGR00369 family)
MSRDLEAIRTRIKDSFNKQTIMTTIGASIVSVESGEVVIRLPFREDISQQDGFVHAGVVTTIIDSACGYAAMTLMPDEARVLTIEFKSNFASPAVGDYFLAKGKVKKSGNTIMITTGEVYAYTANADADDQQIEGKLVSLMQASMMVIHPR